MRITDHCSDTGAQIQSSKSTVNKDLTQSIMEFILAEILKNQGESRQLSEKNSARLDEIVARNAASISIEANKSTPKQLNFDDNFSDL